MSFVIRTFKETVQSLRDPLYGKTIISRTPKAALWYWTRYLILFAVIPAVIGIFALTYYTPQFPHLLREDLPDFDLTVKNGQASSTLKQPYILGTQDFAIILDTAGKPSSLDQVKSGILILRDQIIAKSSDGHTDSRSLKDLGDFHFDKQTTASWLSQNELTVWVVGVLGIIFIALVIGFFYWLFHVAVFFLLTAVFLIITRIFKRPLPFWDLFKIVIYASVLPLIISAVTAISPNPVIDYLNIGLFVYFVVSWHRSLTTLVK